MTWRTKLETQDNAFLILAIDDKMALFLSAFKLLDIKCKDKETLEEAWETSTYSHEEMAVATGLHTRVVARTFDVAKSMGMILPDGRIDSMAEKYVGKLIARKVKNS